MEVMIPPSKRTSKDHMWSVPTLGPFNYLLIYLSMAVLGLRLCARAPSSCGKRGPLLIAVRRSPTIAASPVAEHRLQTRRLSNCGSWAQSLRGMWDPPRPGLEPVSPALAGRLPTTVPPGKPPPGPFRCSVDISDLNHVGWRKIRPKQARWGQVSESWDARTARSQVFAGYDTCNCSSSFSSGGLSSDTDHAQGTSTKWPEQRRDLIAWCSLGLDILKPI